MFGRVLADHSKLVEVGSRPWAIATGQDSRLFIQRHVQQAVDCSGCGFRRQRRLRQTPTVTRHLLIKRLGKVGLQKPPGGETGPSLSLHQLVAAETAMRHCGVAGGFPTICNHRNLELISRWSFNSVLVCGPTRGAASVRPALSPSELVSPPAQKSCRQVP